MEAVGTFSNIVPQPSSSDARNRQRGCESSGGTLDAGSVEIELARCLDHAAHALTPAAGLGADDHGLGDGQLAFQGFTAAFEPHGSGQAIQLGIAGGSGRRGGDHLHQRGQSSGRRGRGFGHHAIIFAGQNRQAGFGEYWASDGEQQHCSDTRSRLADAMRSL